MTVKNIQRYNVSKHVRAFKMAKRIKHTYQICYYTFNIKVVLLVNSYYISQSTMETYILSKV